MLNTNSGPNITLTPNSIALYKNEEGIGDFQKSWKGRSSVKGVGSTKGGILNRSGFLLQFSLSPHISYMIITIAAMFSETFQKQKFSNLTLFINIRSKNYDFTLSRGFITTLLLFFNKMILLLLQISAD